MSSDPTSLANQSTGVSCSRDYVAHWTNQSSSMQCRYNILHCGNRSRTVPAFISDLTFAGEGKCFLADSELHKSKTLCYTRIVGSVAVVVGFKWHEMTMKNQKFMSLTCGFYRSIYNIFHNITAQGKYTLDGYDIIAFNQNLYGENEWDLYFRNHTVALYC